MKEKPIHMLMAWIAISCCLILIIRGVLDSSSSYSNVVDIILLFIVIVCIVRGILKGTGAKP